MSLSPRWLWASLFGLALLVLLLLSLSPENGGVRFEKIALSRNANNTGPVQRTYLIAVSDTLWPALEQYANKLPYTPLGQTRAYFFHRDQPYPDSLSWQTVALPTQWQPYCLASFRRDARGKALFLIRP